MPACSALYTGPPSSHSFRFRSKQLLTAYRWLNCARRGPGVPAYFSSRGTFVPQYSECTGVEDTEGCGWLSGWDRSEGIKANSVPTSTAEQQHSDGATSAVPSGQPGKATRDETGHDRKQSPPRVEKSSADDMLRKAGKHSWGPNDVVPQGRGGKRLSKLKAPKRQQQQTTALFRRVHAVKESQPLLRGDKQERTDSTSSVRLFPHVSDVWERSSAEAAAAAAGKEMTDVGAYMSSKLTGEMIVKVAIKITQQDGSVFLIRKSGEVRDQVRRRGHAEEWQLPSYQVKGSWAPVLGLVNLSRGLLRPRAFDASKGHKKNKLYWHPYTFICGKRLGRPVLVLLYEAVVNKHEVVPARAALSDEDAMWVSAEQYASMRENADEMLMKRCPWRMVSSSVELPFGATQQQYRFTTRPQLMAETEEERLATFPQEITGRLNHGFVTCSLPCNVALFRNMEQDSFLHVASTAVWNNKTKKILIASRKQKVPYCSTTVKPRNPKIRMLKGNKKFESGGKKSKREGKKFESEGGEKFEKRWEFPGGKVEAGETHAEAAVRELHEELGVEVDPQDVQVATFQSYPWYSRNMVRVLFTVDGFTGKAKSMENQEFRWVGLDQLKRFCFMEGDEPFVEWIIQRYKDRK